MNMRFPAFALVAAFALAAVGARTDMALAYHGKLVRVDAQPIRTRIPMQMEFRLCASETPDGSAPLWGRRTNVRFEDGGLFYVELRDSAGTEIDGAKYAAYYRYQIIFFLFHLSTSEWVGVLLRTLVRTGRRHRVNQRSMVKGLAFQYAFQ